MRFSDRIGSVALTGKDDVSDAVVRSIDNEFLVGIEVACVFDPVDHKYRAMQSRGGLYVAAHFQSRQEMTVESLVKAVNTTLKSTAGKRYPAGTVLLVVSSLRSAGCPAAERQPR